MCPTHSTVEVHLALDAPAYSMYKQRFISPLDGLVQQAFHHLYGDPQLSLLLMIFLPTRGPKRTLTMKLLPLNFYIPSRLTSDFSSKPTKTSILSLSTCSVNTSTPT